MEQEHPTPTCPASRPVRGFTLVEIMVVIAIIGLLVTLIVPNVLHHFDEASVQTTRGKMANLASCISFYRTHHNGVPDTLQELLQEDPKNMNEPYVPNQNMLLDAWDTEFIYNKIDSRKYELISLGADKTEGGEENSPDADLSNLDDQLPPR